jgi:hypothetical protein
VLASCRRPNVRTSHTKPRVFCRLLGVVLCYVFAFQGFLAAYSAALAVSQANGNAAAFIICHSAGSDGTADSDTPTHANISCALCAIGASAGGVVPAAILSIVAPSIFAGRAWHTHVTLIVDRPSARAGLARAPPRFS